VLACGSLFYNTAMSGDGELTALLLRFQSGDEAAAEELAPLVHGELHRLARRALAKLPPGQTLQTTALLNEAWMRIERSDGAEFASREHFLAVAAKAMRSVVVDRARRRAADRRGGSYQRIELDEAVDLFEHSSQGLVELDLALEELADARPDLAQIVDLRFFAGMQYAEISRVLDRPTRSVERMWGTAKAWLFARLKSEPGSST